MSGNVSNNYIRIHLSRTDERLVFFDDQSELDIARAKRELVRHCMGQSPQQIASQYRESELPVPVIGTTPGSEEKKEQSRGHEAPGETA